MLFGPYFQSYPEDFSLLWAISSIRLMFFFKWRPFWTPSWVFRKAADEFFRTFCMLLCPNFRSYTENFSLLWAISNIRLMFLLKWRPFWTPSWISWKAPVGFSRTFSMLFYWFFWTYSENVSLFWASSNVEVICFENDGHFGRHLEFLGLLQGDCPELLVCYSTDIPGPILKISASSELI